MKTKAEKRLLRAVVVLCSTWWALAGPIVPASAQISSCPTQVWAMFTAQPVGYYECTPTYDWTLQKKVVPSSVVVTPGDTQQVGYTITACRTLSTVCRIRVQGNLHLLNETDCATQGLKVTFIVTWTDPTLGPQMISTTQSVPDLAPNNQGPIADTTVVPFNIVLCQGAACVPGTSYQITAIPMINNQILPIANPNPVDGFSVPPFATTLPAVDANATVTDTPTCPTGFLCTSGAPAAWSLTDASLVNGCAVLTYNTSFQNVSAPCGQTFTVKNTATLVKSTNTGDVRTASSILTISTGTCTGTNCTFTLGYWKNHASAWPVLSLKLGTVTYNQTQLLQIFNTPVRGNGLVDLAHQLIAAKLNIDKGASSAAVSTAIAAADKLIGSLMIPPTGSGYLAPSQTSSLVNLLDAYNSGTVGPGHCPG